MSDASIATNIVQLLKASPGEKMLGTKLAFRLRQQNLQPSCKLRDFVEAHVPDVARLRTPQSGMDWVYALRSSALIQDASQQIPAVSSGQLSLDPSEWRTFISPHSPYHLYAHAGTGELRVVEPGSPELETPWRLVPRCSVEKHAQVAELWVDGLPGNLKAALADSPRRGTGPNSAFYALVKGFNLVGNWSRFRSQHLLDYFRDVLKDLGIPTRPHKPLHAPISSSEQVRVNQLSVTGVPTMKELVVAVVSRMTDGELQTLNLPIRHVMDVLNTR